MNQSGRGLFVVAVASCLLSGCTPAASADEERNNVQQVLEKYLQSVRTADLTLASQIWSQTPDTSVVTPFGRFEGWDRVREGVYVNFLQQAFLERNLQAANVAIHVDGDTAWGAFDWTFSGKLANGTTIASKGWESHVYRKTNQRWAIVHLHYSVPPPPQAP